MTSKLSNSWWILKETWAPQDIRCDKPFAVLDHMNSHDLKLTSNDLKWLPDQSSVSITITKKLGMLHTKWKLKTAVLQRKYGKIILRSKDWPQADCHWPHWMMYIKRNLRTEGYVLFVFLNYMISFHGLTSHEWPLLTFSPH